jgi:hypothetical protein
VGTVKAVTHSVVAMSKEGFKGPFQVIVGEGKKERKGERVSGRMKVSDYVCITNVHVYIYTYMDV